jgi:hypothetical protein
VLACSSGNESDKGAGPADTTGTAEAAGTLDGPATAPDSVAPDDDVLMDSLAQAETGPDVAGEDTAAPDTAPRPEDVAAADTPLPPEDAAAACFTWDDLDKVGCSDLCGFIVGCGLAADKSQCQIDCEMIASNAAMFEPCFAQPDADCWNAARTAGDCEAAKACYVIFT